MSDAILIAAFFLFFAAFLFGTLFLFVGGIAIASPAAAIYGGAAAAVGAIGLFLML
jgi:hypothetical protein